MIGALVLAYLALGYHLFWRGLHDDLAHIPSVAIARAGVSFTVGPVMLFAMWAIGWALDQKHNYHVWAHNNTTDDRTQGGKNG